MTLLIAIVKRLNTKQATTEATTQEQRLAIIATIDAQRLLEDKINTWMK